MRGYEMTKEPLYVGVMSLACLIVSVVLVGQRDDCGDGLIEAPVHVGGMVVRHICIRDTAQPSWDAVQEFASHDR